MRNKLDYSTYTGLYSEFCSTKAGRAGKSEGVVQLVFIYSRDAISDGGRVFIEITRLCLSHPIHARRRGRNGRDLHDRLPRVRLLPVARATRGTDRHRKSYRRAEGEGRHRATPPGHENRHIHHDFVGSQALADRQARYTLIGLRGSGRRAARAGSSITVDGQEVGVVTSGILSPTLGYPIALARVQLPTPELDRVVEVNVRGKTQEMTVVPLPFYARKK